MPQVSIIIRTKNEARWISSCLLSLTQQDFDGDVELIIIDSNSTDNTVELAKEFDVNVLKYPDKDFNYSKSLNIGCRNSKGDILVFLSAHCIPLNTKWLFNLVKDLESENIVATYGRQIPTVDSDPFNSRDLLTVFGVESKVQKKDFFFHNANSAILKSAWEKINFDERVNGLEDRVWAKTLFQKRLGYIKYVSDAVVYHEHGLNHSNNPERAKRVALVLNKLHDDDVLKGYKLLDE